MVRLAALGGTGEAPVPTRAVAPSLFLRRITRLWGLVADLPVSGLHRGTQSDSNTCSDSGPDSKLSGSGTHRHPEAHTKCDPDSEE